MKNRFPYLALLAVIALVLSACGSSGGSSASGQQTAVKKNLSWTHGTVTPNTSFGYILMAQHRGYYKQEGVNVDLKHFSGNVGLTQALLSGTVDSIETAPGPIYAAILHGAKLKIIGSTLPGFTYYLYAKKSIKTLKDLEGKTIGASAPGSAPDTWTRALLAAKGLNPKDVHVVNAGGTAQRFQALLAGRVDAAAAVPAYSTKIKPGDDVHVLAKGQEIIPKYPRFVIVANEKSLREKPQAAARFLAGEMQGISYAVHHRNAEITLAAQAAKLPPNDPSLALDYDLETKWKAASPTCVIPMDKLTWVQNFLVSHGLQSKKVDLDAITDDSYRQQALKLVAGKIPEVPAKTK